MTVGELFEAFRVDPAVLARTAEVLAHIAEVVGPALVRVAEVVNSIPGVATATTGQERMQLIELWALSRLALDVEQRLAGPDEESRVLASMYEREEKEWLALVEKYGFARIESAYRAFRGSPESDHYAAMVLVEAVEMAAKERAKEKLTPETAAVHAWVLFAISLPGPLPARRWFQPGDFVEAVRAWSGRSGRRKTGEPRQWEALAKLTGRSATR